MLAEVGGKPLEIFLEHFSHMLIKNSLRLHTEDRHAQGLQGSLSELTPSRKGALEMRESCHGGFHPTAARIVALDKHETISYAERQLETRDTNTCAPRPGSVGG